MRGSLKKLLHSFIKTLTECTNIICCAVHTMLSANSRSKQVVRVGPNFGPLVISLERIARGTQVTAEETYTVRCFSPMTMIKSRLGQQPTLVIDELAPTQSTTAQDSPFFNLGPQSGVRCFHTIYAEVLALRPGFNNPSWCLRNALHPLCVMFP